MRSLPAFALLARALVVLAVLSFVPVFSGCAGVSTYFAINAQVVLRDETGRVTNASPDAVKPLPVRPNVESPFPVIQYQHNALVWTVMITDSSFNSTVRSKIASEVCLRFDQASVTSSAQASAAPLRVFTGLHGGSAVKQVMRGSTRDRSKSFAPPRVCFTQTQTDFFWFKPDLSELFPNQRMFNAMPPQYGLDPLQRGVGHWLKMTVPVEYDGKREDIEMKLTATDSEAKLLVGF